MKENVFRKPEQGEPQLPMLGGHKHAPTLIRQWVEMLRRDKTETDEDLNRMLTTADEFEQFRAKRNGNEMQGRNFEKETRNTFVEEGGLPPAKND